ncbi:MAG: hypothetical protein U0U46_11830 [Saprospiraceae bacterium]
MNIPLSSLAGVALFLLGFGKKCDAQCGALLLNCNSPSDTVCVLNENDPLLWSGNGWYDPQHFVSDLPEGNVDLSISLSDTCPGAVLQPRFLLFLDLDGNGSQETVLDSDNLPPYGIIFTGNAANPDYSGGTPRRFDARPIPDSLKWHFVLQTSTEAGGGLSARVKWYSAVYPDSFALPQLPLGRHTIRWIATNGLGDTTSCERAFWVRDCQAPTLECKAQVSTHVLAGLIINVYASSFLQQASDNVTPPTSTYANNLLDLGIRIAGTGTGFPVADTFGNPQYYLGFQCSDITAEPLDIEVWARDKAGNTAQCLSKLHVVDVAADCVEPGPGIICCTTEPCTQQKIEEVNFYAHVTPPNGLPTYGLFGLTGFQGCFLFFNALPLSADYVFTLHKNNDYLNGVSTFDLVLLSKHILGVDPLDSPYKIIAADINRSNTVTTFDIVELRKLILGIYDSLPNNTSWRFFDQNLVFTDPTYPLMDAPFPDSFWVFNVMQTQTLDFYGVKVGDLNCSVIPDVNTPAGIWLPDRVMAPGEVAEIPVSAAEAADWLGFQLALRFDPAVLDIEQVLPGALPGMDEEAFGLSPGRLAANWFAAEAQAVRPEAPLFTLRVKARRALNIRDVLSVETDRLPPELYTAEGARRVLLPVFGPENLATDGAVVFAAQPNPTRAGASIPLSLHAPAAATLSVFDGNGRKMYDIDSQLDAGFQVLEIPAEALPGEGVYFWRLGLGTQQFSGRLLRY